MRLWKAERREPFCFRTCSSFSWLQARTCESLSKWMSTALEDL
jgi:hypothetical protein